MKTPVRSFTLIELLVVIAIIAVLAGMLLPALGRTRETAKSANCTSNLKSIVLASQQYSNDCEEWIPMANWKGLAVLWRHMLASYLGIQGEIYDGENLNTTLDLKVKSTKTVYYCPSTKAVGMAEDTYQKSAQYNIYSYGMPASLSSANVLEPPGTRRRN